MLFNGIALLPEVAYQVPDVNDDAEHVLFIQQASDAWASGQDPLDFWVPQVELGFPQFLYYQSLPHLLVVALGRLTFGLISLRTLFDLVRYLLLVGFPLTVFWSMRRLGFSAVAAAIGAAAGSLISGDNRYGFEYDSYVWRGLGVYTQIFGMHLSFIGLAALHRVATRGSAVIAVNPNSAAAHFNLGLLYRQLGQTADAQTEFATAQRLDPKLVAPSPASSPIRQASPTPTPTR